MDDVVTRLFTPRQADQALTRHVRAFFDMIPAEIVAPLDAIIRGAIARKDPAAGLRDAVVATIEGFDRFLGAAGAPETDIRRQMATDLAEVLIRRIHAEFDGGPSGGTRLPRAA